MALSGKVAAFYKQTGSPIAFSQEPLEKLSDNLTYRIAARDKAYWDKDYPVTIERSTDGGETWVIVTAGFEVQHVGGYVVFENNQGTALFRASGQYFTLSQVGGAFSWTVEASLDTVETPTFESQGWNEVTPTIRSFTGSAEAYWVNGGHLDALGEELIIVFFVNAQDPNKPRYEGYGLLTSVSTEAPVDDVIQEPLEFTGTSRLFYREG